MNPSIALKFLRDGVDSGNIMANVSTQGQRSYNFFKNDLMSILRASPDGFDNPPSLKDISEHIKPETGFTASLGHSDFS